MFLQIRPGLLTYPNTFSAGEHQSDVDSFTRIILVTANTALKVLFAFNALTESNKALSQHVRTVEGFLSKMK